MSTKGGMREFVVWKPQKMKSDREKEGMELCEKVIMFSLWASSRFYLLMPVY